MTVKSGALTRVPAIIEGGDGITITRDDGVYTITCTINTDAATISSVSNPGSTYIFTLDGTVWRKIAYSDLVAEASSLENGTRGDIVISDDGDTFTIHDSVWSSITDDIVTTGDLEGGDITLYPSDSLTPDTVGELNIEATSDTELTFRYKGSDELVRSYTITAEPDPPTVFLDFVNNTYTG